MEKITSSDKVVAFCHDGKVVVDNSVFEKLTLSEKASTLTQIATLGTLEFKTDFLKFFDYTQMVSRLKQGEDVTFELLFNGIEITAEQTLAIKAYHKAVAPILTAVAALVPTYPFASKPSRTVKLFVSMDGTSIGNTSGYNMSIESAKRVFDVASRYWCGLMNKPGSFREETGQYGRRDVTVSPLAIEIGCQRIDRYAIEQLAISQGWTFPSSKAKTDAKKKGK